MTANLVMLWLTLGIGTWVFLRADAIQEGRVNFGAIWVMDFLLCVTQGPLVMVAVYFDIDEPEEP